MDVVDRDGHMNVPSTSSWDLIAPYWDSFDMRTEAALRECLASMPESVADVICIHWLSSEVANGGFHQLFTNSTGILAPEAVGGLQKLGLTELYNIAREALDFFPLPYPRSQRDRIAFLNAAVPANTSENSSEQWDPFYALNGQFYASAEFEDLDAILDAYATRNKFALTIIPK